MVSLGATHDSSERRPPPRCRPETRTLAGALIICWIEDPNPTSFVSQLYGARQFVGRRLFWWRSLLLRWQDRNLEITESRPLSLFDNCLPTPIELYTRERPSIMPYERIYISRPNPAVFSAHRRLITKTFFKHGPRTNGHIV